MEKILSSIISDTRAQAALVLADGTIFYGRHFGAANTVTASITYTTAAMGYQEIITDEANHGRIVLFAYPHIGNTGVDSVVLKAKPHRAAGLIVRAQTHVISHYTATATLEAFMVKNGIVGLAEIDTRRLMRHLRDHGEQKGTIVVAQHQTLSEQELQSALASLQSA